MASKALSVALSEKMRDSNVFVVNSIDLSAPKTKEVAGILKLFKDKLGQTGSVLIITPSLNKDLHRAINNIQKTGIVEARNLNPLETLSYKNLIILKDAIEVLNVRL